MVHLINKFCYEVIDLVRSLHGGGVKKGQKLRAIHWSPILFSGKFELVLPHSRLTINFLAYWLSVILFSAFKLYLQLGVR